MSLLRRLTIIAFALLLALSAAACGSSPVTPPEGGTNDPGASSDTSAQTEAAESDTDDYIIAENGSALCTIVTRTGASADERVLAVSIKTALKSGYGVDIEVREGSAGAGEREIIVGAFFEGIDSEVYLTARYGVWGAARRGNKLLLYALDSKSYSNAASVLPKYIGRGSDEKTVKLRSVFFSIETVHDLPVAIPAAGNAVASYVQHTGGTDTSKKCTQVAFKSVQEDFFKSYCATLESLSYEKKFEHSIGGNSYTAYVREDDMLSVDYFPSLRLMRVVSEPAYETPVWDLASGERTGDVKLFQIKDTTNEHASCFIVTLADGRYLIYDTGVAATADQAHEYMLTNNRFTDGKIHIAAIVISHPHTDHMDGLSAYAKKYAADTVCDAVMYNLVSVDMQSVLATDTLNSRQNAFNSAAQKLGATVYCLRGGQKFTLSGTEFEVVFTADELGDFALTGKNSSGETDTTYDMNNSSLILRMTEGGQTTVFTGDCRGGEAGIISEMFPKSFKGDIMTVAHHGYNVVATLWMYQKAQPKVLFWTVTTAMSDTSRSFVKQLQSAGYVVKHFYEDEAVEITLPYVP